jgi:hypothetical protein
MRALKLAILLPAQCDRSASRGDAVAQAAKKQRNTPARRLHLAIGKPGTKKPGRANALRATLTKTLGRLIKTRQAK